MLLKKEIPHKAMQVKILDPKTTQKQKNDMPSFENLIIEEEDFLTRVRRRSSGLMSGFLRRTIDDSEVGNSSSTERRGSVPNIGRMRLARRRKSIPAYLGYGSVGKTHSSSGDNCFPMFVQMQNSASDEDVSEIAKELLPPKFNGQCFHSKRMAENQKQQLRNYWTLPGLHKAEKTSK